jgi:hypothetical protein
MEDERINKIIIYIYGTVVIVWKLDLQLPKQSEPINAKVVNSNPAMARSGVLDTTVCDKVCQRQYLY